MEYSGVLQQFYHRREYVKMQFASGRTVKEIAEELGVSRQRVYAMLGGIRKSPQKQDVAVPTEEPTVAEAES